MTQSVRKRFHDAHQGKPVVQPVFAVYDWFVERRAIDWNSLFQQGLRQIAHADVIRYKRSSVCIEESRSIVNGVTRRDVRRITDIGELHEYHLGEWRMEYLIKMPEDYRIVKRALTDVAIETYTDQFLAKKVKVGDNGTRVTQLDRISLWWYDITKFRAHGEALTRKKRCRSVV